MEAAGLLALVPFTAMLLTFTRNAYVGTLAALVSYLVLRRPRGLFILAPALLIFFFVVPAPIRDRIVFDRLAPGRLESRSHPDGPGGDAHGGGLARLRNRARAR